MNAKENFEKKAPILMDRLLEAIGEWDEEDAAAAVGNAGHESGGFTKLQEIKPTVGGSRGGYGWFQWTGPRRRAFEAWCKANDLDPSSDEASMQYLLVELKGSERGAVRKTAAAKGLDAKVEAFEQAYERAGVKHYPSRKEWARIALAAWKAKEPGDTMGHTLWIQQQLNKRGAKLREDGIAGPRTEAALRAFALQQLKGTVS